MDDYKIHIKYLRILIKNTYLILVMNYVFKYSYLV